MDSTFCEIWLLYCEKHKLCKLEMQIRVQPRVKVLWKEPYPIANSKEYLFLPKM